MQTAAVDMPLTVLQETSLCSMDAVIFNWHIVLFISQILETRVIVISCFKYFKEVQIILNLKVLHFLICIKL